ncbi:MAG: dTMP kinase [Clostridiales bacterium]|nr:dTMP kinase [Clostridiales bacterium]MDD7035232.1 dTMP kinase [Bacillota bacterium]MDY2920998.1 dTMP kinase [Lentihominibacter sp.]
MSKGFFITFEGMDGSGKSTQIEILKKRLESNGEDVIFLREPGGTPISEKIREIILDKGNSEMTDVTEMLLYAAARAQLVEEVIAPALRAGRTVICDRFIDSSIAYQAYGRELGDCVSAVNSYALGGIMPDLTILLRSDANLGETRIRDREKDRIEMAPDSFKDRVCRGYELIEKADPDRVVGIDARDTVENISSRIWDEVESRRGEA